jgi:phosphoglycolate phosphatase-like HAD superfamily hydrolase
MNGRMRKIVIVDIDGTISKVGERLKYLKQEPKDWDSFYKDCFEDEPIPAIIELVKNLDKAGYLIIFCTGRREQCRAKTIMWLRRYMGKFAYNAMFMRANNDEREDWEVKPEMLDNILRRSKIDKRQIAFILEDRTSMVKKWRELGYTCLQVADGDF